MTLAVLDPGGNVRGTVTAHEPEALLRLAWGLTEQDVLTLVAVDAGWELHCFRPGRIPAVVSLEVSVGHIAPACQWTILSSVLETAWLDLVDEGWTTAPI